MKRPVLMNSLCTVLLLVGTTFWSATAESSQLSLLSEFGGPGTGLGQFDNPWGVAVDSQGNIIIADSFNNRIQICSRQGECTAFGTRGSAPGQFITPTDVAVDSQDRIFVADTDNDRVQICDHQGNCSAFGQLGRQIGSFDAPMAIAADSFNRMVIADQFNGRIQVCDDDGSCNVIGSLVNLQDGWQEFEFGYVTGVAVDNTDQIIVTESIGAGERATLRTCSEEECTIIMELQNPNSVAVDRRNRIFVRNYPDLLHCHRGGRCSSLSLAGSEVDLGGIAFTRENELVASNRGDHKIRVYENIGTVINSGFNDAWYNQDTAGQGFLISVFPNIQQMFVAWFTYDVERPSAEVEATLGEPGHRWLTAQGPYTGDTASLTIYVTEGGVFDAGDPPANNDGVGDGTMTIDFADCTEGLVTYEISSPNLSGEIPIQRIVPDNVELCEALANQ
ncbi:MAG: NHL repeat-containing protein [Xanthomonadales bacterium]|nr:NHL repeat-containing protein [Xanthomonadales bacterium]